MKTASVALALSFLALALVVPTGTAVHPGPACASISKDTTFVGFEEDNCHVTAYVCTNPRYFGGGGGGVGAIYTNWVCLERTYLSDILA